MNCAGRSVPYTVYIIYRALWYTVSMVYNVYHHNDIMIITWSSHYDDQVMIMLYSRLSSVSIACSVQHTLYCTVLFLQTETQSFRLQTFMEDELTVLPRQWTRAFSPSPSSAAALLRRCPAVEIFASAIISCYWYCTTVLFCTAKCTCFPQLLVKCSMSRSANSLVPKFGNIKCKF